MKDRIERTNCKKANHIFRFFIIIASSICTAISLAFTISIISISSNTSNIRAEIENVKTEINRLEGDNSDPNLSQFKYW